MEPECLLENDRTSDRGRDCEGRKETSTENSQIKSLWRDTSRRQKVIFLYSALSTASIYFCAAAPVAFLSRVMVAKSGDKLYSAAILDATFLFASMSSLVCGKYQSKIHSKTFICIGMLTIAISQGCLGCLEYIDNVYGFIIAGFILKSIQGIGQGFATVGLLTVLWHEVPQHVEKSFGMIRSMTGAGYLLSAYSSGYLYSTQNGMMIPCVVSAVPPLLFAFIGWLILHDIENLEQSKDYHAWRYICNPKSVFVLGLAATCGGAFAVYGGSFTSYAQSVGASVIDVGLMFTAANSAVLIASLIAGYFSNVNHTCRQISIAIGFLGMLSANLSFNTNETLPLLNVQVVAFVLSASVTRTLAFPEMIHQSLGDDEELKNDRSLRGQLSGVWYFATSFPSFLYGVGGTALQDLVPYSMSQTISSLLGVFITIIASITVYLHRCNRQYHIKE